MSNKFKVHVINYNDIEVTNSIRVEELVSSLGAENVIACTINGELCDLNANITSEVEVFFLTLKERTGVKIYTAGLKFLLVVAVKELYGDKASVEIKHSLDKGMFCKVNIGVELKENDIKNIKSRMMDIVEEEAPIKKITASTDSAIKYFESIGEIEKQNYYKKYAEETVTIYSLKNWYNYFYTKMPINTKQLKSFDLVYLKENSFVLMHPLDNSLTIPKYINRGNVLKEFEIYDNWIEDLNVPYVAQLNELVSSSKIEEFIQLNELNQIYSISNIIDKIIENKKIRMVLIGGASSSGKTTTAIKFSLHLKSRGYNPFLISVDDYYKNREDSPKREDGTYDFECIEALDLELFNAQLYDLINGKEIIMPKFNFKTGKKEFGNKKVKLGKNDIIIIEGLHTLNEELTKQIPRDLKYKIYASPFTPLGLDRHNHISTADIRLLRRIVRDNVTRGYTPERTLTNWKSVREGEEKYVFPYQEEADAIFNTILVYEIGVLKVFVEPLLYSVPKTSIYYIEAKRLICFLNSFFPIPESYVPKGSTLREFIGNGFFN